MAPQTLGAKRGFWNIGALSWGREIENSLKSAGVQVFFCTCGPPFRKGAASSMKNLFAQYRDGKGTLVISFNDGTAITGDFVKQDDGFLQISGQVNAIGQICYVPYPNENIKYMYWKDPAAPTQSAL